MEINGVEADYRNFIILIKYVKIISVVAAMEESFKNMVFLRVLLICLRCIFSKPQYVNFFIICLFKFLITRNLIVKHLIVVA